MDCCKRVATSLILQSLYISNVLTCFFITCHFISYSVYRFIASGTVEEKIYEKQVHKDGIKRVVLSGDRSTARYFDHSELKDLFKLAPEGKCATLEKFNKKSSNNGAGSTGKPSFLTKHPSVVGVASHDALYSNVSVDVDIDSPKSEETPFSRSPFQKQKTKVTKKHTPHQIEDLTLETPLPDRALKPLGGLSKTRQSREDAKAQRDLENGVTCQLSSVVENVLRQADALIVNQDYGEAMSVLLDLVERDMDDIKGDEKLAVHKKISYAACLLGWLST